jgi:hypothetical protein
MATWRLEQITRELQGLVSDGTIPGAAFIITRGGKYVYHGEVGVRARREGGREGGGTIRGAAFMVSRGGKYVYHGEVRREGGREGGREDVP